MGGGGGGSYDRGIPADEERLAKKEAEARAEIDRARGIRRNLFISFAHENLDEVNLFRGQAKSERSDLEFSDRSVREPFDSNRADYIKQRVSERIKQSSMTVVYVSEFSADSSWVNWEVERSIELGRKVVAFHKGDTAPKSLPRAVKEHNIKVVRWADLSGELD